jgi:hypothetical protein
MSKVSGLKDIRVMRSKIFGDHGFPDADYDFEAGSDSTNLPCINLRAPGRPLQMIDLNSASQIKQKLEFAGDLEGAALFDHLIDDARRGLVTTAPLYVDASRAAQMEHGAETDYFYTLEEAKRAWNQLPENRKEIARITSAGRVYERCDIERFHHQRSVHSQGKVEC